MAALEERRGKWYQVAGLLVGDKLYRLKIRRLTPRECFRLQGFPDWAYEKAESVSSKSQLYKQAGNSVSVMVIEVIARALKEIEEMEKISLTLLDLPNYDCDITVTFEDDYHKKVNFPLFYESNLQNKCQRLAQI